MAGEARGRSRELRVMDDYRSRGWVAYRLAWGNADVAAFRMRDGALELELVQVKSTSGGPYERFGPADRRRLLEEAESTGARAVLAWWPKNGTLRYVDAADWPKARMTPLDLEAA